MWTPQLHGMDDRRIRPCAGSWGTPAPRPIAGLAAAALSCGLAACAPPPTDREAEQPPTAPAASALAASAPAGHADAPQAHAYWSYEDDTGPAHWPMLSEEYAGCALGTEQSPIDLSDARVSSQPAIKRRYSAASVRIVHHEHIVDVIDNGHTIQINYDEGSVLDVGGEQFELVQYHFHAPSEHTVDGRHFPMEMHLVHRSDSGHLAVIGVLIADGAHNAAFDPVWANLPNSPGARVHLEHLEVDIDDLLPTSHRTWRYRGSLTTPPCSEGVEWIVMHEPVTLSSAQIAAFTAIFDGNNRPVQALGARSIVLDEVPETDEDTAPGQVTEEALVARPDGDMSD